MEKILKIGILATVLLFIGCDEFLNNKPDLKMVIPTTLNDAELLLNDYSSLNMGFPIYGELGIDDYYVTQASWEAASNVDQRNAYIWADVPYQDAVQWQRPYKTIYVANQVLSMLYKIKKQDEVEKYKRNLGAAYFYRAFSLHQLVDLHCTAYSKNTASDALGIPLRLNPEMDETSVRATLKDSYAQIVQDYKSAVANLPIFESVKGRPFKSSAYAGLARVYLVMGDYEHAYLYADSCLSISPGLLDYNSLNSTEALPLSKFNVEVLFSALSANLGIMGANIAIIDDDLYKSYDADDLRKRIFFKSNDSPANTYLFKGSYDKSSAQLFVGLTTSEVYLIKAESASRIGKLTEARSCINELIKKRWDKNVAYPEIVETSQEALLKLILNERRKELVFRGRRWSDLKRLNLDARFQKTISRTIGGQVYTLEPNSPKYAFRLSETVINLTGMPQNKR